MAHHVSEALGTAPFPCGQHPESAGSIAVLNISKVGVGAVKAGKGR